MKTNGYIHIHRSLLEWDYHNNPVMFTVWTHLLMLAEYEDCQYDDVTIHRGELLVSQQWLAQQAGITINQVRTCFTILEKTNEITRKKTNNLTHIKILKFDEYQGDKPLADMRNHERNHEQNHERNHDIGININNNKKNLSDGEIQKSDIQSSQEKVGHPERPEKPEIPEIPEIPVKPEKPVMPESPESPERPEHLVKPASLETPVHAQPSRSAYTRQLASHEGWKQKCCRDYHIAPELMERHIIAFHEQLLCSNPGKSWLSFNDFCLHFHSWLRFQTPESIKRLATQAIQRSRQQKAKAIDQQRQQQMWQEIEETKRKAVSYEEYLRNKPLPLAPSPTMGRGKNML